MVAGSTKPLLVLFTGTTVPLVKERFGDFDAHFQHSIGDAWTGPWATVDAREGDVVLPDPASLAGVIVTGSSSSVTQRAETPWMLRLEPWLRTAVESKLPLLGVCFGHQILASALGGEVRKNPRGRHIGTFSVRKLVDDPLFEGVPESFHVNVSHQDHVAVPPPNVRALVTADHDEVHAFAAGDHARAVQFHPEFREEIIRDYIGVRREILKNEGLDADALLSKVIDPPHAKTILRNFVHHFVKKRS